MSHVGGAVRHKQVTTSGHSIAVIIDIVGVQPGVNHLRRVVAIDTRYVIVPGVLPALTKGYLTIRIAVGRSGTDGFHVTPEGLAARVSRIWVTGRIDITVRTGIGGGRSKDATIGFTV